MELDRALLDTIDAKSEQGENISLSEFSKLVEKHPDLSEKFSEAFSKMSDQNREKLANALRNLLIHADPKDLPLITSCILNLRSQVREASISEKVMKSPEAQEYLRLATDTVLKRYLEKLVSPDGKISLQKETICADIVQVLLNLDAKLPGSHPLKGQGKILVENFFTPKEKGVETVRFIIEMTQSKGKPEANEKTVDSSLSMLENGILSLYDVARSSTPEGLSKFAKSLESIPTVANVFSKYPDIRNMLVSVVPKLATSVDKATFSKAIHEFVTSVRTDVLVIVRDILGTKDAGKAISPETKKAILHVMES